MDTGVGKHATEGHTENPEIPHDAPVIDVPHVESQLLGPAHHMAREYSDHATENHVELREMFLIRRSANREAADALHARPADRVRWIASGGAGERCDAVEAQVPIHELADAVLDGRRRLEADVALEILHVGERRRDVAGLHVQHALLRRAA